MYVAKFEEKDLKQVEEGWLRTDLGGKDLWKHWKAVTVEYYEKEPGSTSPLHTHESKQVSLLLQGKANVSTKEETVTLEPMDSVFLDANEPHKMEVLGDSTAVGLNIFVPGRTPDFWREHSESEIESK